MTIYQTVLTTFFSRCDVGQVVEGPFTQVHVSIATHPGLSVFSFGSAQVLGYATTLPRNGLGKTSCEECPLSTCVYPSSLNDVLGDLDVEYGQSVASWLFVGCCRFPVCLFTCTHLPLLVRVFVEGMLVS